MGDDRPSVYMEGGTVVYRASAIGGCERALLAARVDAYRYPFPDVIVNAFRLGHLNEPAIVNRFIADHPDIRIMNRDQHRVEVEVFDGIVVRGALDAYGIGVRGELKGRKVVVDAKAFAPSTFDQMLRDPGRIGFWDGYITQQVVYAKGVGATWAVLAVMEKGEDGLVGEGSRVHYHWIDIAAEEGRWTEIATTIDRVEQAAEKLRGERAPEDSDVAKGLECPCDYACQYPQFHDAPDDPVLTGDDAEVLGILARVNEQIKAMKDLVTAAEKWRNEQVEKLVEVHGRKMVGGGWKVTWVEQEVAESVRTIKAHTRRYPRFSRDNDEKGWAE